MADGFFFDELSNFKKDLFAEAHDLFPKETENFIKGECQKLLKEVKQRAKNEVGTTNRTDKKKSYHNRFKVGKKYDYDGDLCQRVYNGSPHGHLIENGHKTQNGGFVQGKHIFEKSKMKFQPDFEKDCNDFLGKYFDDIGEH